MNEPRRHHYVPQFYQLGFSDVPDGCLWVHDRRTQRYFRTHPSRICFENELYTLDPGGSSRSQCIESGILGYIDGSAAAAIKQISKREWSVEQWRQTMAYFMAFQITRSPISKRVITELHKSSIEETMRLSFFDVGRARQVMDRYRAETGKQLSGVTPESMVDAFQNKHVQVSVSERPFLESMLRFPAELANVFLCRNWTIIDAGNRTGFVSCDFPVVTLPAPNSRYAGPGVPDSTVLFPLSRRWCLYMAGDGRQLRFSHASRADVRTVNQNIAIGSDRFVFGSDRTQLETVIQRTGSAGPFLPRGSTEVIGGVGGGGSLIHATFWPKRNYVKLKLQHHFE